MFISVFSQGFFHHPKGGWESAVANPPVAISKFFKGLNTKCLDQTNSLQKPEPRKNCCEKTAKINRRNAIQKFSPRKLGKMNQILTRGVSTTNVHCCLQDTFSVRESQATSTISALSLELARPSIHRQVVNQRMTQQPTSNATATQEAGHAVQGERGGHHNERGSGRRTETIRQT